MTTAVPSAHLDQDLAVMVVDPAMAAAPATEAAPAMAAVLATEVETEEGMAIEVITNPVKEKDTLSLIAPPSLPTLATCPTTRLLKKTWATSSES